MTLPDRLRHTIATEGPIRFDEYMRMALLDPEDGFYGRGVRLGAGGAFQTGPTLHPAFSRAVGAEIEAAAEAAGGPIDLLELGAGDGSLLAALRPTVARNVDRLAGVEPAPGMRRAQAERLAGLAVEWFDTVEQVGEITGIAVANEFLDALPVRLLRWPDEVFVELDAQGRFRELTRPAEQALLDVVAGSGVEPRRDATYAVCEEAPRLLETLAGSVDGRILVLDYGGEGEEVHGGRRPAIRTYVQGHEGGDPLQAPGRQDLTADVDFGRLRETARQLGLVELRYSPQDAWLRERGVSLPARAERSNADWGLARLLESRLSFRVLLLERRG